MADKALNICRYCDQECTDYKHICQYHDERAGDFRRAQCVECGNRIIVDADLIRDSAPFNCQCGFKAFRLLQ